MKQIYIYIFLIFITLTLTTNVYAQTGIVRRLAFEYVDFGIKSEWNEEEIKESLNYKTAQICDEFIQKKYSHIKFPVFLHHCFENIDDPCYQIKYDTYYWGGALDSDAYTYKSMLKEKSKFSRIGVNIRFHMKDSPEKILKLLEYSIKEEPRLKKRQKKLRKIIETNGSITSQEEDTLVIDEEQLLKILSQPPSPKIINFLKKYKSKN